MLNYQQCKDNAQSVGLLELGAYQTSDLCASTLGTEGLV